MNITHELDNLAAYNILHQIHGICVRVLDLSKDEHLRDSTDEQSAIHDTTRAPFAIFPANICTRASLPSRDQRACSW